MELLTLADREMHEQAIAKAWLWRIPHTVCVVGKMPVTRFQEKLPEYQAEVFMRVFGFVPREVR